MSYKATISVLRKTHSSSQTLQGKKFFDEIADADAWIDEQKEYYKKATEVTGEIIDITGDRRYSFNRRV